MGFHEKSLDEERHIIKQLENLKRQYKSIDEWIECEEVFPPLTFLYVKGTDDMYLADGKNKFNDLVKYGTIVGLEEHIINTIQHYEDVFKDKNQHRCINENKMEKIIMYTQSGYEYWILNPKKNK